MDGLIDKKIQMNGWMDKKIDGWLDGWMDRKKIDGWMDRKYRLMVGCIETNRWMGGQKEG